MENEDIEVVETEDVEEEVDTIEGENTEEESTNSENVENPESEELKPFMNVKYNKEDRGLSQEEAQLYAQKGMNYDKIHDKLSTYETAINSLAGMQGMTADQWLEQAAQAEQEQKRQEILNQGAPEELVDDILYAREERARMESEKKEQEQLDKIDSEYKGLTDYLGKEIAVDDIPDSVIEVWQSGVPLKYAYMEYERPMLEEQIEQRVLGNVDKRNNASTGTINTNTSNSPADSAANIAAIENMSDEEFAKQFL